MHLTAVYFVVKFCAYAAWMWVGLRSNRATAGSVVPQALLLGAARLLMGLGFGFTIWTLTTAMVMGVHTMAPDLAGWVIAAFVYLGVYVPIRWIEWAIMDVVIRPEARTLRGFVLGAGLPSRRWRAGGIVISCLADIPVIAVVGGLPLGRFMC